MAPGLRAGIWMMLVVSLFVYFKNSNGARAEPFSSMEIEKLEKPQRPRVFTSPEELKAYLGALARYYATVSRNRFGKRGPPVEGEAFEFPASAQETYDVPPSTDK